MRIVESASFLAGRTAILDHRPRMAALLGTVAIGWAEVEETLALLFAWLLGQNGEPMEYGRPVDPLGVEFFHETPASYQRLRMVERGVEHRLSDGLLLEFKAVKQRVEHAGKLRNRYLHNRMGVDPAHADALVMCPLVGDMWVVEENDLMEAIAAMDAAMAALRGFESRSREEVRARFAPDGLSRRS